MSISDPFVGVHNPISEISELLGEITRKLQLDDTRFERAETAYRHVGQWLEGRVPPTGHVEVYPQGSMRLQTTVKPRGRVEYDLDIVVEARGFPNLSPAALYGWGQQQLLANGVFAKILEPMRRCLRLNYADDFHLDVLFAVLDPDPSTDAISILVPDKKLGDWSPSNPNGYAKWFEFECDESRLVTKRDLVRAQAPLPNNEPVHLKALLKQDVQLFKRLRDVRFDGDDEAPRSIVLTTLSAQHYLGEATLYEALVGVVDRILLAIETASVQNKRLLVLNPTNVGEDFSEAWDEKPAEYGKFVKWIVEVRQQLHALPQLHGPQLDEALRALFGEVVGDARRTLVDRFQRSIEAGRIRNAGRRLTGATGVGSAIPPKTFFGDPD